MKISACDSIASYINQFTLALMSLQVKQQKYWEWPGDKAPPSLKGLGMGSHQKSSISILFVLGLYHPDNSMKDYQASYW